MKNVNFALLLVVILIAIIIIIRQFLADSKNVRKKLERAEALLIEGSVEELKIIYEKIHQLYLKLNEEEKKNFYAKVETLRKKTELFFKMEKKLVGLLLELDEKEKREDKIQILNEARKLFHKLPGSTKDKYAKKVILSHHELNL